MPSEPVVAFHVPDGPRRIVCLSPESADVLYRLGAGDRIVGICAGTIVPDDVTRPPPVVTAFGGGSVRRIAELRPDLVLAFSDVQADLARDLVRAGLAVVVWNQRTVQEILDAIVALGNLVGAAAAGRRLADACRRHVERIAANAPADRPRVYFEEWDDPMVCGIGWVSELVEIAGGVDVFADRAQARRAEGRTVTPEEVAARAPQVVLASWCGKPFDRDAFLARPGFADLPAARSGRIHEVPAHLLLQPGPTCL
ncbi:MAG: cobalamin-binding protein, partial [Deltaproteobacteria bacterium]